MKKARVNSQSRQLRTVVLAVACWAIASVAPAAVVARNAAGVQAGIAGIYYYPDDISIGVLFFVTAPTATNISTFTIQKSLDLKTWTNYSSSITITGSLPLTEISDYVTARSQFYRMQLSN